MIWNTYYRNSEVPSFPTKVGSFWWRGYCSILNDFKDMTVCKVACGGTIKIWYDKWDDDILLSKFLQLFSFAKDKDLIIASARI